MKYLTIGQLAKRAGVNIDTIRYYEKQGLIPEPLRRESGYRQYSDDSVKIEVNSNGILLRCNTPFKKSSMS